MSLWSKAKKLVQKGAKYLPGIAQALPSSKGLATAAATLQTVSGVLQGAGVGGPAAVIPGIAGPIPMPKPGAPMSIAASSFPSFPALPGGSGGGIVKTGFPAIAAAGGALVRAAPAVVAGARGLLARISPKVAKALGWATVGGLVYDAAGNLQGRVKRRQMNPLNPRAARRAVRRIKSVRQLCAKIERTLPKARASRRCK